MYQEMCGSLKLFKVLWVKVVSECGRKDDEVDLGSDRQSSFSRGKGRFMISRKLVRGGSIQLLPGVQLFDIQGVSQSGAPLPLEETLDCDAR